jgi:hypothetical protein
MTQATIHHDYLTFRQWLQSQEETAPALGDPTLAEIARNVASLHGQERIHACQVELNKLNGKGLELWAGIKAAIEEWDKPESKIDTGPIVPELPEYARLTNEQEQEAAKAGGWLDAYVDFARKASPMTPEAFHIAAGVFIGALAIARRLRLSVSVSENDIYPNLYLLYIGPSTVQRKSTAVRVAKGLLKAAGMEQFFLAERQTPEALALDMTTRIPHTYDAWTPELQERWLAERAIAAQRSWLLEEASHLLDSFNRDFSAGLLPMVLDLYDCPDEAISRNTVARGRELIERPYLSIFGVTTYGAMAEHMSRKQLWANGFFARFALVGSDMVGTWCFWPEPQCYPNDLVQRLRFVGTELLKLPKATLAEQEYEDDQGKTQTKRIVQVTPPLGSQAVEIERGGEAWQAWERYARATTFDMLTDNSNVPGQSWASYGRLGTMLIKVAMILAGLDAKTLPIKIEPWHIYRAQQIVETWRENLHCVFGNLGKVQHDDMTEGIKAILAQSGENWTTRRDLLRALNKTWPVIETTINDLAESGEIERQPIPKRHGRKSEQYRLAVD